MKKEYRLAKEVVVIADKIKNVEDNQFYYKLPISRLYGDCNDIPLLSQWKIYEDDRELGPAHSLHADIKYLGSGRYSHWLDTLYFSSSDNTDPRTNGRKYRLVLFTKHSIFKYLSIYLIKRILRRHSVISILFSLSVIFICRFRLLAGTLVSSFRGESGERESFKIFYKQYCEMFDREDNGCLFTQVFMKYVEKKYFQVEIKEPSLEIGVYNGIISRLYFNYPFHTGTELFGTVNFFV